MPGATSRRSQSPGCSGCDGASAGCLQVHERAPSADGEDLRRQIGQQRQS